MRSPRVSLQLRGFFGLGPVSRKFGSEKPFIIKQHLKTERFLRLEPFVRNGTSVYIKNM